MDTKFAADAKIADASRNYKMQKAGFDQEVNARVSIMLIICEQHRGYVLFFKICLTDC